MVGGYIIDINLKENFIMIKNIIGLGAAGCNIADEFSKISPDYKCFKIDVGLSKSIKTFPLKRYAEPEDYENNPPKLKAFFKNINNDVLFCLGGSGDVSNAALVILEQLQHCKISVLYIKPDLSFLGAQEMLQENLVFGVLQELARSGVFERLYIVSNLCIEEALDGLPMIGYFEKINEAIVSTFHMINVLKQMKPVVATESLPPQGARISTFGIVDVEKNIDRPFFSLDTVTDIVYLYAYNQKVLESKKNLLVDTKTAIKRRIGDEKKRVTFNVYATNYEQVYAYFIGHTSLIQTN